VAVTRRNVTSTRQQLLDAARAVLQRDGVAALSTRSVGAEAGVNLSLIHYYFGSRDGLLLAILEQIDADLLARQRAMYGQGEATLAEKWRQAVDFYRQDLESGYIRALMELASHGYSNPEMAERVRELMAGWRNLLVEVAAEALPRLGITAVDSSEIASMIVSFWYGMDVQHLLGVTEAEGRLWQTLETLGHLIERLENGEG
jgi:AcrR family transcriptional regulator